MSKIIKITESQMVRLMSEQKYQWGAGDQEDNTALSAPPVTSKTPPDNEPKEVGVSSGTKKKGMVIDPTYKPDMSTGWLGHNLKKDIYVYNGFGGQPFHSSYFCPRYTNIYGDKQELPNKEITDFRNLIFKLTNSPGGPKPDAYYMDNVYKGLKYYINNIESKQSGFVSEKWSDNDIENYTKMLEKFSRYIGSGNLVNRCWHYSVPDIVNQVIVKTVSGVWEWTKKCGSDYHCLLDVASIVVLIAPPPVGVLVSAGLDMINSIGYYGEGNYIAGSLTLLGVIPGVMEVRKMTQPAVIKAVDEILIKTSKITGDAGSKVTQEAIDRIFQESIKVSGLSVKEIKSAEKYLNALVSNQDVIRKYSKVASELGNYDKKVLIPIINDPTFKQLMKTNKGDIIKSLTVFSATETGRDLLIQVGAFGLVEVLSSIMTDDTSDKSQMDIEDRDKLGQNILSVVNDTSSYNWEDDIPDEWK